MDRSAYIGVDLGTGSIKAVAFDDQGDLIASAHRPLKVLRGEPGKAEQHPDIWSKAGGECLRELTDTLNTRRFIPAAVAATGQMDGPVLLSSTGDPLRAVPLWCDTRCVAQCDRIQAEIPDADMLQITGHTTVTGYTAPKLLWIRDHDTASFERAAHVVFPKDYLTKLLTGEIATDLSDASNSLLLDVSTGAWASDVVRALGLESLGLPVPVRSCDAVGYVTPEGARWSGLPTGLPVAAGAGDSIAAALGAGMNGPAVLQLVLGTAGNVNCVSDDLKIDRDGRVHTGLYVDGKHWIISGVLQSSGGSLAWWSEVTGQSPEALIREVRPDGMPRTLFAPYLAGERTPHLDARVRGAFFALDAGTTRADMTRALLEGVAFSFRDAVEVFRTMGIEPSRFSLTGGLANSDTVCRIMAEVLALPVERVLADITVRGAAILAACVARRFSHWREAATAWPLSGVEFSGQATEVFADAYHRFQDVYPRLREHSRLYC